MSRVRAAVLDTNALLLPVRDGTDVQAELERLLGAVRFVVPSSVRDELDRLTVGDGVDARAAKAALHLVARAEVEVTGRPGDDGVLDVARRLQAVVVTNDRRLAAEAKAAGLVVVGSRGKGRLSVR